MKAFTSLNSSRFALVAVLTAWTALVLPVPSALAFSSEPHATPKINEAAPAQGAAQLSNAQQAEELIEGEIKKIDKTSNKVTIKHGDIKKFDMPGMTMNFRLKNLAMLEQLNIGDKIRFNVEKIEGVFVLTHLEQLQ